jgi:hypothetical protein
MNSPAPPPPPPTEAAAIRLAREAAGLSAETAAARMKSRIIGGSRWRQIEAGYRKDSTKPVIAPRVTLAHMALVVGLSPERLDELGRSDAAEVLREIRAQETGKRNPARMDTASTHRVDERWRMLEGSLRMAAEGLNPGEYRALVNRVEQHLAQHPEWQPPTAPGATEPGPDPRESQPGA